MVSWSCWSDLNHALLSRTGSQCEGTDEGFFCSSKWFSSALLWVKNLHRNPVWLVKNCQVQEDRLSVSFFQPVVIRSKFSCQLGWPLILFVTQLLPFSTRPHLVSSTGWPFPTLLAHVGQLSKFLHSPKYHLYEAGVPAIGTTSGVCVCTTCSWYPPWPSPGNSLCLKLKLCPLAVPTLDSYPFCPEKFKNYLTILGRARMFSLLHLPGHILGPFIPYRVLWNGVVPQKNSTSRF